jgi:hypothetical protein
MGKPVVANARCDVLKGQCIRSNAGLFYDSFEEFFEILRFLGRDRRTCEALGRNGREYFLKHYAWPVIERKYLDMLDQLKREDAAGQGRRDLEAPPGLFHRWRKRLPPAQDVVAGIPAGPEIPAKRPPVRRPPRPAHRGGEARHAR